MSEFHIKKFGGTSIDKGNQVLDIIENDASPTEDDINKAQQVAVVSAFSNETDKLIAIAKNLITDAKKSDLTDEKIFDYFQPRIDYSLKKAEEFLKNGKANFSKEDKQILENIKEELGNKLALLAQEIFPILQTPNLGKGEETFIEDRVIAIGERFSAEVLATTFTARSKIGRVYDAIDLNDILSPPQALSGADQISNRTQIENNLIDGIREKLQACFERGSIPIFTGYAGYLPGGIRNMYDRGYTEDTAALVARSVKSIGHKPEFQIWKEIQGREQSGIFTADPRKIPNAFPRSEIGLHQLAELAESGGMKAVNRNVMGVLWKDPVPLRIKNTNNPKDAGTLVLDNENALEKGINHIALKDQTMFTVSSEKMEDKGMAMRIFKFCADLGISVDAITTSRSSISFSIPANHPKTEDLFIKLTGETDLRVDTPEQDMTLINLVGMGMANQVGILHLVTSILAKQGINIEFDCGHPDRNITLVVAKNDAEKAAKVLHAELFGKEMNEETSKEKSMAQSSYRVPDEYKTKKLPPCINGISEKEQSMFTVSSLDLIDQPGVASKIFELANELGISVDAITTSTTSVSFSVDAGRKASELFLELTEIDGFDVKKKDSMTMISLAGNNMRNQIGVLRDVTGILAANGVNIEFDCGNPDNDVTVIINNKDRQKALEALKLAV